MNEADDVTNSSVFKSAEEPDPCPICLSSVTRDAYLDRCFHRFCFDCILRWERVVSSRTSSAPSSSVPCPLCKTPNFSVVHSYVESASQPDQSIFQRHYIGQDGVHSTFFSEAHQFRWWCYSTEQGALSDTFDVIRYWKSGKYLQVNPWLQRWLKREIQALTQEEDVDIILHHFLGVIESFSRSDKKRCPRKETDLERATFKAMVADAARPFLLVRTDRFVCELELFLASGLTIEAYDRTYKKKLGWQNFEETSERTDDTKYSSDHLRTGPYTYLFDLFEGSSDEAD